MKRFCRQCGEERETYADIVANQHVERCKKCHRRLADGEILEREKRARLPVIRYEDGAIVDACQED